MLGVLSGRGPVVLADRTVGAKGDRRRLSRQIRLANWAMLADDPHPGDVCRLHVTELTGCTLHDDLHQVNSWWTLIELLSELEFVTSEQEVAP